MGAALCDYRGEGPIKDRREAGPVEDERIIELYFRRDESAISETRTRYGAFVAGMAGRLLEDRRDTEECVSDTYLAAWNAIPPERPLSLRAFLGRLVRNIAISRFRKNRAEKRYLGLEAQLEELAEAIPADTDVEREMEARELGRVISRWLDGEPKANRDLFIRRYFYGESVEELARQSGERPNTLAQRLRRMRLALREELEKEEYTNEA